jgi:hypothetical protein
MIYNNLKTGIMKRMMAVAFAALALGACNSSSTEKTDNDTVVTTDTVATQSMMPSEAEATTSYNPAEGDVTYRNSKVMVWRNGDWTESDKDVTLENGVVVYRNGKVKKEDKVIILNDGEVVTKTGNFFDKTGHAIENAWDATKEGVRDAANAVKKAGKEVGETAKDIVNPDSTH